MSQQDDEKGRGGVEEAFDYDRRSTLERLRRWAEVFTEEEMDRPFLSVGRSVFSLRKMIEEVERGTEVGRYLIQMAVNSRLQFAREGESEE
jgi:hypothetical protein